MPRWPERTTEDRFFEKVDIDIDTFCFNWTAHTHKGYARMNVDGESIEMHLWAYRRFVGAVPTGLQVDHLCRNRRCVYIGHMELVTSRENNLRGEGLAAQRARQTHCKHGHAFDEANTHIVKNGTRKCRKCNAINQAKRRARNPELTRAQERAWYQERKNR